MPSGWVELVAAESINTWVELVAADHQKSSAIINKNRRTITTKNLRTIINKNRREIINENRRTIINKNHRTISNTNRELVTADRPNRYDPRCILISSLCFDRADFYAPCRLDGQSGARRWRCALRRRVRSTRRTCPKGSGPARRTSDYAAHNKKPKV